MLKMLAQRHSRVANVTFTYRFGKPLNGNGQRKKGSASDEQNRVKTGEYKSAVFEVSYSG
jgi:hypothetical protein